MNRKKGEDGAVMIIEATIVFPIVFLILFLLIYLGNAYFLKAKIDSYVEQYAIVGAAECADPILTNSSIPTSSASVDSKPYRYIFTGYMDTVASDITGKLNRHLKESGFFSNMPIKSVSSAKANTKLFYSTFSVEVEYTVKIPINLLGTELDLLKFNSRAEVPVTDVGEFIRNVDMALDYIESSKSIQEAMSKVKEFLGKVGGGG